MKIKFLKDHLNYKTDDEITNHPNEDYLIKLGVAVEVKKKEKKEKNANGTDK